MLPKFPEFKKLQLSDRSDIESFTAQYQPYSDFNFETMWAWDVRDNIQISELSGNLVIVTPDHHSDKLFCSFLGNHEVNETIRYLLDYAHESKMAEPVLRLVPEVSLLKIDFKKYYIEIDLSFCDYIYDLELLSGLKGSKYSNKRKIVGAFARKYPSVETKIIDILTENGKGQILALNEAWCAKKNEQTNVSNFEKELLAIERFLKAEFPSSTCVGVYIENQLVAYSVFTIIEGKYAMCQFSKADVSYVGVYDYLMHESAICLSEKGCKFLNYQEDLGISGLRFAKNAFRPVGFLRKYTVKEF